MTTTTLLAVALFSADFVSTIASVTGWALFGVLLSVGSLKLYDLLTPGDLHKQVFVDGNQAAATVYGAALIGFALIVASAIH